MSKEKGPDWVNFFGLCPDGARAMFGMSCSVMSRMFGVCPLTVHSQLARKF